MADERNKASEATVKALRKLLLQICKTPEKYRSDKALTKALKSQGGLYAIYENEELGIKSTSINTVKRVTAEIISGGFEEFDKLRISARQSIEEVVKKDEAPNKRTRAGLAKLVKQQEDDIEDLRKVNFALLQTITEISGDIKTIAKTRSESVRLDKSQQTIKKMMAMLTMNSEPFNEMLDQSNITPFRAK